jgi:hypothetical protein
MFNFMRWMGSRLRGNDNLRGAELQCQQQIT